MRRVRLREIAHSRAGDKGNTLILSLIPYREADYEHLRREVTVDRVRELFGDICRGEIIRYEIPTLAALNFVLHNSLAGGVTASLAVDSHGKCYSSLLLGLEIAIPD